MLKAKYVSTCPVCWNRVSPGDPIEAHPKLRQFAHFECARLLVKKARVRKPEPVKKPIRGYQLNMFGGN